MRDADYTRTKHARLIQGASSAGLVGGIKVNNWLRELGNVGARAAEARNFCKCVFHRFCRIQ
jgi:hypothetical protein